MALDRESNKSTVRYRAPKACTTCNRRRVRCDASSRGVPCTKCEQSGNETCEFVQSKRGSYVRKRARVTGTNESNHEHVETARDISPSLDTARIHPPVPVSSNSPGDALLPDVSLQLEPAQPGLANNFRKTSDHELVKPAAIIPTFPADQENIDFTSPKSLISSATGSSYHEITWGSLFDHFLDTHRQVRQSALDKCSITYLGESFPLSMVLADLKEGGKMKLHHPGPPVPENESSVGPQHGQHPPHMLLEDISFLKAKGAFDAPPTEVLSSFKSIFLDRVYPLYPIVNRKEFIDQWNAKKIPWILLHSLCFIASTYCSISILHRAGFTERKEARFHYYSKAKALFDLGYEVNKVVILQSVILLAFWAGGPNEYWNFYSWISTGVTIAEILGIHRSMAATNMTSQDRGLLRRLWWILVIRDASCCTLVGRPFRINMEHCDAEMLTMEDFEYDVEHSEFSDLPLENSYSLYQIHMAELSLILRQIVAARFKPELANQKLCIAKEALEKWRTGLPNVLSWNTSSPGQNIFAWCLSVCYDHNLILANLGQPAMQSRTVPESPALTPASASGSAMDSAAQRILSLACTIIRKSLQLLMPQETFPAIFLAQAIFYAQTKSGKPLQAMLGQAALNTCQMVWHSIAENWDSAPWVMNLFDNLMADLNNDSRDAEFEQPTTTEDFGVEQAVFNMQDFDMSFGYESWQSHPMLASIFDLSQDRSLYRPTLESASYSFGDLDVPNEGCG